jgi:hypothetical protein
MSTQEKIDRGREAERLLNNHVLSQAFEAMLGEVSLAWLATKPVQIDDREELYARAQAISSLRARLTAWMNDAKLEAARLEKQQRRK